PGAGTSVSYWESCASSWARRSYSPTSTRLRSGHLWPRSSGSSPRLSPRRCSAPSPVHGRLLAKGGHDVPPRCHPRLAGGSLLAVRAGAFRAGPAVGARGHSRGHSGDGWGGRDPVDRLAGQWRAHEDERWVGLAVPRDGGCLDSRRVAFGSASAVDIATSTRKGSVITVDAIQELMYGPGSWDHVSPVDWANVLATFPLFSGVGKRQLRRVVRRATFAEYGRGDIVIQKGEPGDRLYVILGGSAKALGKPASR